MITCPKCNKELNDDAKFCDGCGASVTSKPKEKKKLPKKVFLFGGIGLGAIALLTAIVFLISSLGASGISSVFNPEKDKKPQNNYAVYLKDEELFYTNLKADHEALPLTSRLVDTDDTENFETAGTISTLGLLTCMSEDGKLLFYPDKIRDDEGVSLYYREVNNPEAEAVKIGSNIVFYNVNQSATIVTYIKGDERSLYQYKLKDDSLDKIASEIASYKVSDDGAQVAYLNSEGGLYLKRSDEDREKIASDVTALNHLSADFATFYYTKDGALYKHAADGDREKIASEIHSVLKVYDTGEIYYLTCESEEISLKNYVKDDKEKDDAAMAEPTYPEFPTPPSYPSWWAYDTADEYEAAYDDYVKENEAYEKKCDQLRTKYEEAQTAYYKKLARDDLRNELQDKKITNLRYTLCFFDGAETSVITDDYASSDFLSNYTFASDAPVISYKAYNRSAVKKVKLSEIESIDSVENTVRDALSSSADRFIAAKDTTTVIEQVKDARSFRINASGTTIYYLDDIPDEKDYGELYRISITDGVIGKPEACDSDVYTGYYYFVSDNQFAYFKDCKDDKGDLYINEERIDYDVWLYSITVFADQNKVLYFTDWNNEKEYGTLKINQDGETTKIADDAHSYSVIPDGRVLYLYDYSLNYNKGELHEWDNEEVRKIDDDVFAVLPVYDSQTREFWREW